MDVVRRDAIAQVKACRILDVNAGLPAPTNRTDAPDQAAVREVTDVLCALTALIHRCLRLRLTISGKALVNSLTVRSVRCRRILLWSESTTLRSLAWPWTTMAFRRQPKSAWRWPARSSERAQALGIPRNNVLSTRWCWRLH